MISHIFPYTITERDNILDVGTIVSEIKDLKQILGKSEPISQNNYIELRTVDNANSTKFSKWKIPNDSFYTNITNNVNDQQKYKYFNSN